MTKEELYAHPGWEWCTFEGARRHTLLMGLQSTFREKLEWLEEAESLTLQMDMQPAFTFRGWTTPGVVCPPLPWLDHADDSRSQARWAYLHTLLPS